jgi:hypothetical protein
MDEEKNWFVNAWKKILGYTLKFTFNKNLNKMPPFCGHLRGLSVVP